MWEEVGGSAVYICRFARLLSRKRSSTVNGDVDVLSRSLSRFLFSLRIRCVRRKEAKKRYLSSVMQL